MYKNLYVTDLDGTLLDDNAQLNEGALKQINKLISEGTQFTIASARGYQTIKSILSGIEFNLPIIEFNGGYITDFHTGKHLMVNNIEHDSILDIYELIKYNNFEPLISVFDGKEDDLAYLNLNNEGLTKYVGDRESQYDKKLIRISDISDVLDRSVMAFTVIDEKEKILDLEKKLVDKFDNIIVEAWEDMYYRPWYWLSIHSEESTKGNAIQKLCEINKIKFDKLITFGDNTNDIEMFNVASKSYAVENSVDELKSVADEIIGSNNDNSVINKIVELENGTFI